MSPSAEVVNSAQPLRLHFGMRLRDTGSVKVRVVVDAVSLHVYCTHVCISRRRHQLAVHWYHAATGTEHDSLKTSHSSSTPSVTDTRGDSKAFRFALGPQKISQVSRASLKKKKKSEARVEQVFLFFSRA